MKEADGIVVDSPVCYAGPNSALCALLDRAFYASGGFAFTPDDVRQDEEGLQTMLTLGYNMAWIC